MDSKLAPQTSDPNPAGPEGSATSSRSSGRAADSYKLYPDGSQSQTHGWKLQIRRMAFWWCRSFHQLGWPIHGHQVCLMCGKSHKIGM